MSPRTKKSDPPDTQSRTRKSRKSKKASQTEQSSSPRKELSHGEGEGDDDNTPVIGSQTFENIRKQLTALQHQSKTQDNWPKQLSQHLDEREAEVMKTLTNIRTKLDRDKSSFEDALIGLFEAALAPVDDDEGGDVPEEPLIHIPFPSTATQAFVTNLSTMIDDCHTLTSIYNDLASTTPPQSCIPKLESDLKMDRAAIMSSIAAGKKLVIRDMEGMLADGFHEVRGRSNMTAEDEARGRQLMIRVRKDDGERHGLGFGETAMALEKVAMKLELVGRRKERRKS